MGREIAGVPGGHAARESDAVHRHVGVFMWADFGETVLAERPEAKGRSFDRMREDSQVPQRCA
jgi:hypothetical protein